MELQENLDAIRATGTELWVISPDGAEDLEKMRVKEGLTFPLLMDGDLRVTKAYGILNEENGKIPHPAAIIVDRQGTAAYVRVDENYRIRPPTAEELLPALEAASKR